MKNTARKTGTPPPQAAGNTPDVVREEESLLRVVLSSLDRAPARRRTPVDDAATLVELRDALAEAKPEDQGPLVEQMHRVAALARQRGRGDTLPVDRRSPYFGHLRLLQDGRRRDVLIGQRGYVEPGGTVQIVDWRHAPVSRLFYRYDEGDVFEERLGGQEIEGEILARRSVTIVDAELRRVATAHAIYYREPPDFAWRSVRPGELRLGAEDCKPSAVKPADARLGTANDGRPRPDRFLPAIAALIDPHQFELISRPSSGIVVVQGAAGSGKTTIGLHRIAYLNYAEPGYFAPGHMLVIVYERALATYVSRVLPELEVPGVKVQTFASWAEEVRKATFPGLRCPTTDTTPAAVANAKSHGAMLAILADRQAALVARCRQALAAALGEQEGAQNVLAAWDRSQGPVDARVTALARWSRDAPLSQVLRARLQACGARLRMRTCDVVGEWAALLTDRQALEQGFARHAPGVFSASQLDGICRWCADRERLRTGGGREPEGDEAYALDVEDQALLLRIHQLQRGPLQGPRGPIAYHHLMVDEVQDFGPVELAVLLDCTTQRRSLTLAGDGHQAIASEHGFENWKAMLTHLELPHECVEALRISYRSTRQIMDAALFVLGPLCGEERPEASRSGAEVRGFHFPSAGEACEFLARSLRDLFAREPAASAALIARHSEQARAYFEALSVAEVPGLRWVADQDFSFRPGIDVTDVRQTKGLEFDIVILLEVNAQSYPDNDLARRFLHVAMTRAAHQLWITYTGAPSPLLPASLRG
ncbi:MAG: ATP-binding domain-containing protein [Deltaproteobacteria bacterium]|nr:ATP-binding domain-containing protein [Deltaproteobacteria bacterium]